MDGAGQNSACVREGGVEEAVYIAQAEVKSKRQGHSLEDTLNSPLGIIIHAYM